MKVIFCLRNMYQKQTSYVFFSSLILIALLSSLALAIFLIHENEIASLQNINHYYDKQLQKLVQSGKYP